MQQLGTFLIRAVFDLRLGVVPKIELLLPTIGLLSDMAHPSNMDVAAEGRSAIDIITVEKLGLRVKVVGREGFEVGFQVIDSHPFAGCTIEARFGGARWIGVV